MTAAHEQASVPYNEKLGPPLFLPPASDNPDGDKVFELGLVLAGAVSAGAYTGGVLDFLFEALDEYEKELARSGPEASPFRHRVRLKVVSGASAGGMTAAMLATAAKRRFPHIHTSQEAERDGDRNPFYRPWVRQIDMRLLLGTRDLPPGAPVRSLLDCTPLDDILKTSLSFRECPPEDTVERAWLDQPLRLVFAITNLRGVAYSFAFEGSAGGNYTMTRHNDCARFWVNVRPEGQDPAPLRPDAIPLHYGPTADALAWGDLGQAALATAAFPVALRARTVRPNPGIYDAAWLVTTKAVPPPAVTFNATGAVRHLIEAVPGQDDRRYAAADGGVIDNEPLELARIELAGILGHSPREGHRACRALIMVDPFPDPPGPASFVNAEAETMLSLAGGVVSAMKNQGRFHPEDIELALDEGVASRFMISPSGRGQRTGGAAIASGALGGFSGFLSEVYRRHDFLLGRANCQKFLRDHFCLDLAGKNGEPVWLFKDEPAAIPGHDVKGPDGVMQRPILPLFGTAAIRCERPDWPVNAFSPGELRGAVSRRIEAVGRAYIAKNPGLLARLAFAALWGVVGTALVRLKFTGVIIDAIGARLREHGLIVD